MSSFAEFAQHSISLFIYFFIPFCLNTSSFQRKHNIEKNYLMSLSLLIFVNLVKEMQETKMGNKKTMERAEVVMVLVTVIKVKDKQMYNKHMIKPKMSFPLRCNIPSTNTISSVFSSLQAILSYVVCTTTHHYIV